MKKIFVVLDVNNNKALKAFADEVRANDFADEYYDKNDIDTRVDEVWYCDIIG